MLFEHGDRFHGGAAGRQHGINDKDLSFRYICRKLAVIFHRLQCLRISVQTDMTDFRGRDEGQHTFDHAQARAQDGHDRKLLALKDMGFGGADGGLYIFFVHFKISGSLIAFQHGDLADRLAEFLGTCLFTADNTDLMLYQGVIHVDYFCHFLLFPVLIMLYSILPAVPVST